MACAKSQGKRCSRPPVPEATKQEIERLYRTKKHSVNQISKRLGVAYCTAWNYVQALHGTRDYDSWPAIGRLPSLSSHGGK